MYFEILLIYFMYQKFQKKMIYTFLGCYNHQSLHLPTQLPTSWPSCLKYLEGGQMQYLVSLKSKKF